MNAEEAISELYVVLKVCQQDYGSSRKVASELDPKIQEFLRSWLTLLNHGLSPSHCGTEFPSAWILISNLISSDDVNRFKNFENDDQRLTAWLRCTFNDKMFDKYLRIMLSNRSLLQKYYEPWSAVYMLSADPSLLIKLTSNCLASVIFSFTASSSAILMPKNPDQEAMPIVSSAVSASSYNDVLSAWAAQESGSYDDATLPESSLSESKISSGEDGMVPLSPNKVSNSNEALSIIPASGHHSISNSSCQPVSFNSPQGADSANNSDSSAPDSIGKISMESYGVNSLQNDIADRVKEADRDNRSAISLPFISSRNNKTTKMSKGRDAKDDYSYTELKQLLLSVMQEKQNYEKKNQELEGKVTEYRDRLIDLEGSIELQKKRETDLIAAHQLRISASAKENDILKQQLKKYIMQIQSQNNLSSTESVPTGMAERKILELSEMHGELMEFIEQLQAKLRIKERRLTLCRQQLTALRGPLPPDDDDQQEEVPSNVNKPEESLETIVSSSRNSSSQQLIHVWVPLVFLKAGANPHHIYQIYLRLRDDEWNVFRRYSEIHTFHQALKRRYPAALGKVPFPPKKTVGNKKPEFVENRRQSLQTYLRTVLDLLAKSQPEFSRLTRAKLLILLPFFDERQQPGPSSSGISNMASGSVQNNSRPSSEGRHSYTGL